MVIGVHAAKFDAEKATDSLRKAVLRYDLRHPVVNDAAFAIWNAYAVRAWPTLALIDPDGHYVGSVSGEGHGDRLEQAIARLEREFGAAGRLDRTPRIWAVETTDAAPLAFPGKIAASQDPPMLFIADSNHHRVVLARPDGTVAEVIGSGRSGKADGGYAEASFQWPQGMFVAGNVLFVADTGNHLIRRVDLAGKKVSTIAGTGAPGWTFGGKALATPLNSPWDVALDGGRLFIAMAGDHRIWALDLAKGTVAPFAGSGREDIADGGPREAAFAQPSGLSIGGGKLWVADSESSGVRAIDPGTGTVSTVVGEGLFEFGDRDGTRGEARLQHPLAVLWRDGLLYVADTYNHKIKVVDPARTSVRTLFGDGPSGAQDGDRPRFFEPSGLAVLGDTLYVADTNNHAVRACDLSAGRVATLRLAFPGK